MNQAGHASPRDLKRLPRRSTRRKSHTDQTEAFTKSTSTVRTRSRTVPQVPQKRYRDSAFRLRRGGEYLEPQAKKNEHANPPHLLDAPGSRKEKASRQSRAPGRLSSSPKSSTLRPPNHLPEECRSVTLSAEPTNENESSQATASSQLKLSNDHESESRRQEREKYRQTGDFGVFRSFLAPFTKGEKKKEYTEWKFSDEQKRWWREEKSTGSKIWAPTPDSFL